MNRIPAMKPGEEITFQAESLNSSTLISQVAKLSVAKVGDDTFTAVIDPTRLILENYRCKPVSPVISSR